MNAEELNDRMIGLVHDLSSLAEEIDRYRLKRCSTLGYYFGGRSGHRKIEVPVAGEREAKLAQRWLLKKCDEIESLATEMRHEIEDAKRHAEWAKKLEESK